MAHLAHRSTPTLERVKRVRWWMTVKITSLLATAACLGLVGSQVHAQTPAVIETPTAAAVVSNIAAVEATVTPEPGLATAGANQRPTPQQVETAWVVTPASPTATPTPNGDTNPIDPGATVPVVPTAVETNTATTPDPNITVTPVDVPVDVPAAQPFSITIRSSSGPTRTVNLGEQIVFTVELRTHDVLTESVFITATIPDGTEYVPDSAVPAQVTQPDPATPTPSDGATGNSNAPSAAKRTLSWGVLPMGAGQLFIAQYTVVVSQTTSSIVASARSLNLESGRASASNAVVLPTQPTAITLIDFNTQRISQGVKIIWQTGQELNTFGFLVLRSNDGNRSTALTVNQSAIAAQGSGGSYEFVDNTAQPNQTYTYWLQEMETSGALRDYGPIVSAPAAANPVPQLGVVGASNGGGVPLPVPVAGVLPRPAQTAQAILPPTTGQSGSNNSTPGQITQVQAQPVATNAPASQQNTANTAPLPAAPVLPTSAPQPVVAPTPAAPIVTIAPPTLAPQNTLQPDLAAVNNPSSASTATASAASNGGAQQPANAVLATPISESASASNDSLPAAPAAAQPAQVNAAAAPQSNEESRNDRRWGPLNWLLAGLFACFGWLIVSSFLAVAVGRYLKGRQ